MRHKRTILFTLLLLAALIGCTCLWLRAQQRQYALNRQLIDALKQANDRWALRLVNAGADPNTRYKPTPVPSLPELVKQLLHRSAPVVNASQPAFSIACGAYWKDETVEDDKELWKGLNEFEAQRHRPDDTQLVQAMLSHGANVNAKDKTGITPLIWATRVHRAGTVRLLLLHGASTNDKDENRWTPLITAARCGYSDIIALLLAHKANIDQPDENGWTPLQWAIYENCPDHSGPHSMLNEDLLMHATSNTVRQLLEGGASVNLRDVEGRTPLHIPLKECIDSGGKSAVIPFQCAHRFRRKARSPLSRRGTGCQDSTTSISGSPAALLNCV